MSSEALRITSANSTLPACGPDTAQCSPSSQWLATLSTIPNVLRPISAPLMTASVPWSGRTTSSSEPTFSQIQLVGDRTPLMDMMGGGIADSGMGAGASGTTMGMGTITPVTTTLPGGTMYTGATTTPTGIGYAGGTTVPPVTTTLPTGATHTGDTTTPTDMGYVRLPPLRCPASSKRLGRAHGLVCRAAHSRTDVGFHFMEIGMVGLRDAAVDFPPRWYAVLTGLIVHQSADVF